MGLDRRGVAEEIVVQTSAPGTVHLKRTREAPSLTNTMARRARGPLCVRLNR